MSRWSFNEFFDSTMADDGSIRERFDGPLTLAVTSDRTCTSPPIFTRCVQSSEVRSFGKPGGQGTSVSDHMTGGAAISTGP